MGLDPGQGQTEADRPQVGAKRIAAERRALREAVAEFVAGTVSQAGIARRWNEAGLLSSVDAQWAGVSVRSTLLRPALAGRIEYADHGQDRVSYFSDDPIIDEALWLRMGSKIMGRRRGRPRGERHMASGVIRCGVCGRGLNGYAKPRGSGGVQVRYFCNPQRTGCGKISIEAVRTDAQLRPYVIARLSDPGYAKAIELGHHDQMYGLLNADLEPLFAERDALLGGINGPSEVLSAAQVAQRWDTSTPLQQRALLLDALGSDHHFRVLPTRHRQSPCSIRPASCSCPRMNRSH